MSLKNSKGAIVPQTPHWQKVFVTLQEDGVEFFVNSDLEPMLHLPNDGFQQEWPVNSQRVQDLLVSMHFEVSGGDMLKPFEKDFLLSQIREECRKGGRRLTEVEAVQSEMNPIIQAILVLMNGQAKFSDRTFQLVKRLRDIQAAGTISLAEEISTFTNAFVRQLNRLIPVLRGYGVEVCLVHREDGSHCTLTRLESFQMEPTATEMRTDGPSAISSAASSVLTPSSGTELPMTDDTDGEIRIDPPRGRSRKKEAQASKEGGAK